MKVIRSAILPYSAMQMYSVVADVSVYPEFLNWCENVDIVSEEEGEVVAKLKISYTRLRIQFTTRNENQPGESIHMTLVDGPFTHLQGQWTFKALSETACKVTIEMDFAFDSTIAKTAMSGVFKKIVGMQLDAFQKRAKELYNDQSSSVTDA